MDTLAHWNSWLRDVASEDVVLRPDGILAEALGNLRWLNVPEGIRVSVEQVDAPVTAVIEARRTRLGHANAPPMVMYWWHDVQAGQLRFSLVSACHGRLPFGCTIVPATDLREVITFWLTSPWLRGIPLADLQEYSLDEWEEGDGETDEYSLPVWSTTLP